MATLADGSEYEELRLALVMNGGVSLAIWMGGVTNEINRLVRQADCYGELLELIQTKPKVDVISGTSAGGINGALLATAIVFGRDYSSVRSLWLERASISDLLRKPLDRELPSLLDGNGYFHDELHDAFAGLCSESTRTASAVVPIDLTITTTLLRGEPKNVADDFGTLISDVNHRGKFTFRRGPDVTSKDPFENPSIVDQLALAARCTASFPVAFEASFCRVESEPDETSTPNMYQIANFGESRFVVDGGVLDNKPFGPALEAVFRQRGNRSVRRVLAYIVPDPGLSATDKADKASEPPDVAEVTLASLLTLPRAESALEELRSIRRHNRDVMARRRGRIELTENKRSDEIEALAKSLFQLYRRRRRDESIDYIVANLSDNVANDVGQNVADPDRRGFGLRGRREWLTDLMLQQELPWVPSIFPDLADKKDEDDTRDRDAAPDTWHWGTRPVEHASQLMLDALRRTERLCSAAVNHEYDIRTLWDDAFNIVNDLEYLRKKDNQIWQNQAGQIKQLLGTGAEAIDFERKAKVDQWAHDVLQEYQRDSFVYCRARGSADSGRLAASHLAREAANVLVQIAVIVAKLRQNKEVPKWLDKEAGELEKLIGFFVRQANDDIELVVRRMLAFEIVDELLGVRRTKFDQIVELIQISGNNGSPLGGAQTAARKLAGVQLAHFGAFYKKSWRANDWMFGRLDGAERMVQILMNPERLRLVAHRHHQAGAAAWALNQIKQIAVDSVADDEARRLLNDEWTRANKQIGEELEFLNHPENLVPEHLPKCAEAVTRRLHLEILQDELLGVAKAAEHDASQGCRNDAPGVRFLQACRTEGAALPTTLRASQLQPLFAQCRVGEEKLRDEVGTDYFTGVVSQTLAVCASAGYGIDTRLGWLRSLFQVIRAPILIFYLMARNVLLKSSTGVAVNVAVVSVGCTLLVLHYFSKPIPGIVLTAAWAMFAAAVLYAVMRKWWAAALAVAGIAVVVGVAWWFEMLRSLETHEWRFVAVLLGIVVACLLIGSVQKGKSRSVPHHQARSAVVEIVIAGGLGAIVYFSWGMLAWMALPLHTPTLAGLPDEVAVTAALKSQDLETGVYIIPWSDNEADWNDPESAWMKNHKLGPIYSIYYHRAGSDPMNAGVMVGGFLIDLLAALLAASLLSSAVDGWCRSYARRVVFVTGLGVFVGLIGHASYWNWMHFPTDYTLAFVGDVVVGWTMAGLVIAAVVRPAPIASSSVTVVSQCPPNSGHGL